MTTNNEELTCRTCRTCLNDKGWHEENKPLHPFNTGEAGATAFLGQRDQRGRKDPQRGSEGVRGVPRTAMPMDPVLRQALVDAGVITPQQLREAEEKIQAITGLFNQGGPTMRGVGNGEGEVQI